jgi:hypothetical protein
MSTFTVISFFTQDWEYPQYAQRLTEDCSRLDLDHSIEELASDADYLKNCNKKPRFIQDKLLLLKRPVLWMDADGSIVKYPVLLDEDNILDYDIAGNRAEWDADKIHVGSIWFNYTPRTLSLIDEWQTKSANATHDDDVSFNQILKNHRTNLKILLLPQEYFVILKSTQAPVPQGARIVHRLSTGASKEQYKNQLAKVVA